MATHSSFLACKIPWTEVSAGLLSKGSQRIGRSEQLSILSARSWKGDTAFKQNTMQNSTM